jgi:hypothetical protein
MDRMIFTKRRSTSIRKILVIGACLIALTALTFNVVHIWIRRLKIPPR